MNGTDTMAEFKDMVLDPAKRRHYQLAWLSTVDHKRIGVLYMLTGLFFLIVAGIGALVIRLPVAVPSNPLLAPDSCNDLFTFRGTTMMFCLALRWLLGFVSYILPCRIGPRDMAFPRLDAFGYCGQPFGGILFP